MRKQLCHYHLKIVIAEFSYHNFSDVEFFDMSYKKSKYHLSKKMCEATDCDQDAVWICHMELRK